MTASQARRIRCEWGLSGARHLALTCPVVIIIDVLSFTTAVDVATARGALIYPASPARDDLEAVARSLGAERAGSRNSGGRYTLSPPSLREIAAGTRLVLPSPNGSAISGAVAARTVFAGSLRNAAAVAAAAMSWPGDIGVVPAGEQWGDGTLRPAIEDLLGAGAVIAALDGQLAPEAAAARAAFRALGGSLRQALGDALSGRELIEAGYSGDVDLAAELNVSAAAPRLVAGAFRA
jgi:2-phosphosulfolactate phosphatase